MSDATDIVRICTTCRHRTVAGNGRELRGSELLARVSTLAAATPVPGVVFVAQECLSACDRGCAVAFSGARKWTYVFGGLDPREAARDLLTCAALYRAAQDGFLERSARPERLRPAIVARVPPVDSPDEV